MRQKITQRSLSQIRAQALQANKDIFLWCEDYKGFGVKASKNGHVSFVVQKYINNKSKRITVGHHPWLSLKQAQKEAAIIVANLYLQKNYNQTAPNNILSNGDASKKLEQTYNIHILDEKPSFVARCWHHPIFI